MSEILSLRNERSKTFDLGGGRRRLEAHCKPIHYKDDLDEWRDVNIALGVIPTPIQLYPFQWLAPENTFTVGLRGDLLLSHFYGIKKGDETQFEVTLDEVRLSGSPLSLPSAFTQATINVEDNELNLRIDSEHWVTVQVSEAFVRTSIRCDTPPSSFEIKQVIDLTGFQVTNDFTMQGNQKNYIPDENGRFWFEDQTDPDLKLWIPKPIMWAEDGTPPPLGGIEHELYEKNGVLYYVKISNTEGEIWLAERTGTVWIDNADYFAKTNDGYVYRSATESWATCHDHTDGTLYSDDTSTSAIAHNAANTGTECTIVRSFFEFDTSGIGAGSIIDSALISIYGFGAYDSNVSVQKSTWSPPLGTSQYDAFSGSEYGHSIAWSPNSRVEITFNSTGKLEINKTGATFLCTREYTYDYLNSDPDPNDYRNGCYFANQGGTSRDPKLVIEYTAGQTVSPNPVVINAEVLPCTVVSAGGPQTVNPVPVPIEARVLDTTISKGGVTKQPVPVAIAATVLAATLVMGAVTVQPDPVPIEARVLSHTVVRGGVTVTPDPVIIEPLVLPCTVQAAGGPQTVLPDPVVIEPLVLPETLIKGGVTVQPSPVIIEPLVLPSVTLKGALTVDPVPVPIEVQVLEATTVKGGVTVNPAPVPIEVRVLEASISIGTILRPSPVPIEVQVLPATVTATYTAQQNPIPIEPLVLPATVVRGGITVQPDPVSIEVRVLENSIELVSVARPSPVPIEVQVLPATIVKGAVTVQPTPVVINAVVLAEEAVIGDFVTPTPVVINAVVLEATTVKGGTIRQPVPVPINVVVLEATVVRGGVTVNPVPVPIEVRVLPEVVVYTPAALLVTPVPVPIKVQVLEATTIQGAVVVQPDPVVINAEVLPCTVSLLAGTVVNPVPVPINIVVLPALILKGTATVSPKPVPIEVRVLDATVTRQGIIAVQTPINIIAKVLEPLVFETLIEKGPPLMPIKIPEKLVGGAGAAIIERYTSPKFVFTALTELEDVFVRIVKKKLETFEADQEVSEPPPVLPAYNPGDRKYHAVIIEAQLNQSGAKGIGYNRFEIQYQPIPNDPNTIETWIGYNGDATYTIEIFVRALNRYAVCYYADWIFAALMDPVCQGLAGHGIKIPYEGIRFSGRAQEMAAGQGAPDGLDKFWMITFTIPNIIVPWARLYRLEGPVIQSYEFEVAPEETHNL